MSGPTLDPREELLKITGRAKALLTALKQGHPAAKVRSEEPFRTSKAYQEAELQKRLSQNPPALKAAVSAAASDLPTERLKVLLVTSESIREGSPAWQLLQGILNSMGLRPEERVLVGPEKLDEALETYRPRSLFCFGEVASQNLLQSGARLSDLRGEIRSYRGLPLMATYHPQELLANEKLKRPVWEDTKKLVASWKVQA